MALGDRSTFVRREISGDKEMGLRQTGSSGFGTEVALAHGEGRDIKQAAISVGVGTTELVAAISGKVIYVVSYVFVLAADGTVKFTDGVADLTGAMDISAKGGVVAAGRPSSPWFWAQATNRAVSIVTTGGAARGHLTYFAE